MVIRTPPDIDFSTFPESDGEPMAETYPNVIQMVDLLFALKHLFGLQGRGHSTAVGANQFVYYNRYNGRDNISPDVYVIFDHQPHVPPSWKTWIEGKFPDIVFEITSPSTQRQDLSDAPGGKLQLYAELGAREYYIYDPQQEMAPPFLGYELRGGQTEPLPALPGGGILSPLLGTELRPVAMAETAERMAGVWLRVIDPRTGQPIQLVEEEHRAFQVTLEQLTATEGQLAATAEQLATARERLAEQERARAAAEERAARAEAALRALLADPTRTPDSNTAGE